MRRYLPGLILTSFLMAMYLMPPQVSSSPPAFEGTRDPSQPTLNFTYLNHDGVSFGSTAFRVWDKDLVIFIEAFPNQTTCMWDPETIKEADIVIQSPHGHVSHYDPDEVAMVVKNTGAFVVGNSQLKADMEGRGVDSSKIIELSPSMGGKVSTTITSLNVKITAYGMEHTWMSGVQDDTFLVEMPSGSRWYHGTCTSGSVTEGYMANYPELKGLDTMILDFDLVKSSIFTNYYPEYVIKDHDYNTYQATVYDYKQSLITTLSHNQTFKYTRPVHVPTFSASFDPDMGDEFTNFTFSATYKYWYDREPNRAELFIDGSVHQMKTDATSGWRTGVTYYLTTKLSPGPHVYHIEFDVDGKTFRIPDTGELAGPRVNFIPELLDPSFAPVIGDTDTTYRFRVTYKDGDGDMPLQSYLFIDGERFGMRSNGTVNYTLGTEYIYDTKLSMGGHSYSMEFSDGKNTVALPGTGEIPGPDVARANYPPVLTMGNVDSKEGTRKDTFSFTIRYRDVHGDAPVKKALIIDGTPFNMTQKGTDIKKGVEFYFDTKLWLGSHLFRFEFNDGRFEVPFPSDGMNLTGPVITNLPPTAVIASPAALADLSTDREVLLDSKGSSDPEGDGLNCSWSSDLDGPLGAGSSIKVRFSEGFHTIRLMVEDGYGGNSSEEIGVNVIHYETVLVPEIVMTPSEPKEGQEVTVQVKVANSGNLRADNVTVSLTLDGSELSRNFIQMLLPSAYKSFKATFKAAPGSHFLNLSVTGTEDISRPFLVMERPNPVASAGPDINATVGVPVDFDASRSTSEGSLVYFHWDFGDGGGADGRMATHTYSQTGSFEVALTVQDDLGKESTDSLMVIVKEKEIEQPPEENEGGGLGGLLIAVVVIIILVVLVIAVLGAVLLNKGKKGQPAPQVAPPAIPAPQTAGGPLLQAPLPTGGLMPQTVQSLPPPQVAPPVNELDVVFGKALPPPVTQVPPAQEVPPSAPPPVLPGQLPTKQPQPPMPPL